MIGGMESYLPIITIGVGGWMTVNGVLHDIAVLRSEHGKQYDRNLLRLLMDGHILITCGVMQMISFSGLQSKEHWAFYVAGTASISLLVYCAMIYPFLKSFGTMALNLILLGFLIAFYK